MSHNENAVYGKNCGREKAEYRKNRGRAKGICLLIVMLLCSVVLSGCKTVEKANLIVGWEDMKMYIEDPSIVKSIQHESFYTSYVILGMEMGLSPSDPGYRGIIHLTEEAGKEMFEKYQWKEDSSALPVFTNIDTTPYNSDTWYVDEDPDFSFFNHAMCRVTEFRFNGKDTIIFGIQTF